MNLNWVTFMTITGAGYLCYYLALLVTDAMFAKRINTEEDEIPELTFVESSPPEKISLEDFKSKTAESNGSATASLGIGGVSLQNLFVLARQDAIQYTKSVSF